MNGAASLGRVGILTNPRAGAGPDAVRIVLARLFEHLRAADVILNDGTLEAQAADACGLRCARAQGEPGDACRLTGALLAAGVDTIVGVGGDGTLADIGSELVARSSDAQVLGIGVGSSNVGPLIAATAAELDAFMTSPWDAVDVHALDIGVDGERVGVAFHDMVPANTYFGTRAGRRVDLDAAAALGGLDRVAEPASVCGETTWIAKNGKRHLVGDAITGGQIVASPLNDVEVCRGKAVSGFLCWGPYVGCRGVVAVASALMIRTLLTHRDLVAAEPLRLAHLGLAPGDVVEVGGLARDCAVVVDGTPRAGGGPDKVVSVRVLENAVHVIRRARGI